MPSASSFLAASTAMHSSEPVPMRMTSGVASPPCTTYAPFIVPSTLVVSMLGMPWRDMTRVEGRLMPLGFCGG